MEQRFHADTFFHIFICVNRCNTAACRTEFLVREAFFLHDVLHLVIRQTDYRFVTYFQVIGSNLNSLFGEFSDLADKMFKVNDHAVAHDINRCLAENAGGKQVQDKLSLFVYDRMTGIVASLIAADDIIIR